MSYRSWDEPKYQSFSNQKRDWNSFSDSGTKTYLERDMLVSRKQGHNSSISSPRVNGKLVLKTNPHSFESVTTSHTPTGWKWVKDNYWYFPPDYPYFSYSMRSGFHDLIPELRHGVVDSPSYQQASLAFYNDAANLKVSLAVALRERQQTINMIGDRAMQIVRAIRLMKKGKLTQAASALGSPKKPRNLRQPFADQWLEYHYGWVPLYHDIYGAMIATVDRPLISPYKITRSYSESGKTVGPRGESLWSYRDLVTAKGMLLVNDPAVVKANELGLVNPALVAWELVPYSFVIDWFIPVGDWIASHSALAGLTLADTSVTTTKWRTSEYTDNYSSTPENGKTWSIQPGNVIQKIKTKSRSKGVLSKPDLRLETGLSLNRALSAISLLSQLKS